MPGRWNPNIYKGQRVSVFVDVQNLYYSAKFLYQTKINFLSILNKAVSDRSLIRDISLDKFLI